MELANEAAAFGKALAGRPPAAGVATILNADKGSI
jgi:hypothetical protein